MNWKQTQLKYVSRFAYGDALPSEDKKRKGNVRVFGSNGPYTNFSQANTKAPVIVVGRKGSYGKVNWSGVPVFASDTTFFIDHTTTHQHLRWLFYVLQTLKLDEGSNETAVPGLNRDYAYQQRIIVPPPNVQRAIADFLDCETATIDELIAAKERLLDLLAEKRRTLITQAVTHGLNPNVPLKDSGVEWLREIPEHWMVAKIKHLAQVGNGSTPYRDSKRYWRNGTFPWLTSSVVNDDIVGEPTEFVTETALRKCHLPIVRPDSVLVAITGQGKTRGKATLLPYQATINQHIAFISPQADQLQSGFLQLYLSSVYTILRMLSEAMGSTKGALTCEQLGEFFIPLPPLQEQSQIISAISEMKAHIDSLTKAAKETIQLLQERRVALITEAVTGKLHIS